MILKTLKKITLCTMLISGSLCTARDEMTDGRWLVMWGITHVATVQVLHYLSKKKIIKKEESTEVHKLALGLWSLAGFISWVYDYTADYPAQCIESALFWTIKNSYRAATTIASSPLYLGNALIKSAQKRSPHLLWGTACVGLGVTAWYFYRKYTNTRGQLTTKLQTAILTTEINIREINNLKSRVTALEDTVTQLLDQNAQPGSNGMPPTSPPVSYLSPVTYIPSAPSPSDPPRGFSGSSHYPSVPSSTGFAAQPPLYNMYPSVPTTQKAPSTNFS